MIAPASVTGAVQVAPQDARAHFANHTNDFVVPEKVIVQVVEFPVSNYLAQARATEQEAMDYYNEHMDRFSKAVETNAPAVGTNPPARIRQTVTQPFGEVKSNSHEEAQVRSTHTQTANSGGGLFSRLRETFSGR